MASVQHNQDEPLLIFFQITKDVAKFEKVFARASTYIYHVQQINRFLTKKKSKISLFAELDINSPLNLTKTFTAKEESYIVSEV